MQLLISAIVVVATSIFIILTVPVGFILIALSGMFLIYILIELCISWIKNLILH